MLFIYDTHMRHMFALVYDTRICVSYMTIICACMLALAYDTHICVSYMTHIYVRHIRHSLALTLCDHTLTCRPAVHGLAAG